MTSFLRPLFALMGLGLGLSSLCSAQTAAPAAPAAPVVQMQPTAASEMEALKARIMAKIKAGQESAEALAPELKEFEALAAKYRDPKSEEAARIPVMQALLYLQVLEQSDKAVEILKKVKVDFPETEAAKEIDGLLEHIAQEAVVEKAKKAVVGQQAPALEFVWSSAQGPKSLAELKGKVVVIDFWATWCGPCVRSFPDVRELTAHYKGSDVVVLGVTSLQGRIMGLPGGPVNCKDDPEKEEKSLAEFVKLKDMTWTVVISASNVFNPAYGVSGIPHMAIIAPDGTVRHNGLHPASPLAEKTSKIDAILKEFGLKVP